MKRLLLVLMAGFCAGQSLADTNGVETLAERYWRIHRERNATTRYGAFPYCGTNAVENSSGELGDLVVTFDDFEISAYSHVGPLTGRMRFTVPFETAQGWTGYVLEGHTAPTDIAGCMSEEYIICDPTTSGNLVMMWNYGSEFLSIDNLYTDTPTVKNYFGSYTGTIVFSREAAPITVSSAVSMSPEDIAAFLAPPEQDPAASEEMWYDVLAIPEGNWLVECPIEGTTNTAWRAALCQSNFLQNVVWRYATGVGPTNLPVTIGHDASRVIGRVEDLFYEQGTGVIARISFSISGYAEAVSNKSARISPDVTCFTTVTNIAIRTDGWEFEHQDYVDQRLVPYRDEDYASLTNVPAGITALVMAPVYIRGISLVRSPLLPTEWQKPVPDELREAYPIRPYRGWHW